MKRLGNIATNSANNMSANAYLEYKIPFIKGLTARASYARNQSAARGTQVGTQYTIYQFNGVCTYGHIFHPIADTFNGVALPDNTILKANTYSNGNRLLWNNTSGKSVQSNINLLVLCKFSSTYRWTNLESNNNRIRSGS